jgi:phosphoribosylformimino-5-aminoimidazole carboxamide ribotide isomerase
MIIIPAVDIKDGRCVRLLQGKMDAETVFSDDPAAMARRWADEGAALLHLVDLNGAVNKRPENLTSIKNIVKAVDIPVQVGGGIRNMETLTMYIELGVAKVVIGSEAVNNPELVKAAGEKFPGQVVVGIDARDGRVATEGWTETTGVTAVDLARQFEDCGVAAVNFTDINRDGMRTGPNIEATRMLAEAVQIPVVASGGVSTINDIKALAAVQDAGITGVIVGRALYDGSLDLAEAMAAAA